MKRAENIQSLPGFRDFAPPELALRTRIFEAWSTAASNAGFEQYDAPPLEAVELYTRKSGDEIVGQLYEFEDKGGRHVALRPEMTPSLARMLAERSRAMPKPIRWFSMPQLFRYERQQRGRLREHFQWNVDIVGEPGTGADAEVIAVALEGLRLLGLTGQAVEARIADRPLLRALLTALDVSEDHHDAVFQVIDKLERAGTDWAADKLIEAGLGRAAVDRLLELIPASNLDALRIEFADHPAVLERLDCVQDVFARLEALGFGDWLSFDLTIVRGLAYYTGTVFEVFDRGRTLRALCGGGRYDRLLELVGGDPLPAVGFGMGDVVLGELLADLSLVPDTARTTDAFVVAPDPRRRAVGLNLVGALRRAGHSVSYALSDASMRKQFKAADACGARIAVIVGPDEIERGKARLRDMRSGTEREVDLDALMAGDEELVA